MKDRFTLIISSLIIADLLTGFLFNVGADFFRIGLLVKITTEFIVLGYYIVHVKNVTILSMFIAMIILFSIWIIGSLNSFFNNPLFSYPYSFLVLNRYFFLFIMSCLFFHLAEDSSFDVRCKRIFEAFFIVNNILIFLGVIFHINFFSTYNPFGLIPLSEQRFGYKGLISGGNDVAGLYIIGVAYFFRKKFVYEEGGYLLLIATVLSAMFTGTKATFIAVLAIGLYYMFRYRIKLFFGVMVPLFSFILVYGYYRWDYIKEKLLDSLIQKLNSNPLTYLMSGRNDFIIHHFKYIGEKWNLMNHLVGDGFLYSETDFLDLYFFFGIIGLILYMYLYARIFFSVDRSLDNLYVFVVLMGIAFTAGHIIQSAVVPLFVLLYVFSIKRLHYD
ncbi:MAG TPA: hypothetical protein VL443_24865 [Cyclobacteriaceae bacterium]|jgi:hypothetical protein|nr:hypothetical protein [Cyclobacteriaceae bacterium]